MTEQIQPNINPHAHPPSRGVEEPETLVMPDAAQGSPVASPGVAPPSPIPPTSFGRQMVQLVLIPATIVVVCLGFAFLFGTIAGAKDSLENHLLKLRQSSGAGKLKFGLQDPRYKDRGLAAYNIATMIPSITDPDQRRQLSDDLIDILDHNVTDDEQVLQLYLLMAIGQLGQEGGLDAIIDRLDAPGSKIREGAVGAVLSWPDPDHARTAIGSLTARLQDESPNVCALAAAALGQLARPGNDDVIEALRDAMQTTGSAMREAQWNAAVALARLGDRNGSGLVVNLLLDRQALSQLPAGESGSAVQEKMAGPMIDRIMVATLAGVAQASDPVIWDKIRQIADKDPNASVRNAALNVLAKNESVSNALASQESDKIKGNPTD